MGWLFGPVLPSEIPREGDRLGPAPPPPRTAHAPGVRVYTFDTIPSQSLLRLDSGSAGFFLEGEEGGRRSAALLVLTGGSVAPGVALAPSAGDVLIWTAAALADQPVGEGSSSLSLEELCRTSPERGRHIRRDDLGGKVVPGITGLRVLARVPEAGLAVLRLGPPPGARWVFRGVTAVAVFSGRLAAVDGENVKEIRAGFLARVADPSATLYLEAGNDAALAVALAVEDFVAALG